MANVVKQSVRVRKVINGTYEIDTSGSIDAVHYIHDNGFEELAVATTMIISFEHEYVKTQIVELWRQDKNKDFLLYFKPSGRFMNSEMITDKNLYYNSITNEYVTYTDATIPDTKKEILDPFGEHFTPPKYERKMKPNYYNAYTYRDKTIGVYIRRSLVSEMIKK
jgi:hypothetical protein